LSHFRTLVKREKWLLRQARSNGDDDVIENRGGAACNVEEGAEEVGDVVFFVIS